MSISKESQFEIGVHGLKVPGLEVAETPSAESVALSTYNFLGQLVDLNREHFSRENEHYVIAECYVHKSNTLIKARVAPEGSLARSITVYQTPVSLGGLTKVMHMDSAALTSYGWWRVKDGDELAKVDVEFEGGDQATYRDWRVKSPQNYKDRSLPDDHLKQQIQLQNLATRLTRGTDGN